MSVKEDKHKAWFQPLSVNTAVFLHFPSTLCSLLFELLHYPCTFNLLLYKAKTEQKGGCGKATGLHHREGVPCLSGMLTEPGNVDMATHAERRQPLCG